MAKKFSQFPSAASISPGDSVVGLKDGANTRFFFATVLSSIQSLFVPTSRKVNNKALTTDITLNASDVGAVDTADVGVADGVASLDSNGKVPGTQLDLSGKQDTITASGIIKGDGQGGVSAATPGTDYQAPLTAGTDYATPAMIPSVPSAYTSNPAMDGTASPGSSGAWARGNHVHPSDTSRVPVYGLGKNLLDNAYFVGGGSQLGDGIFPINQRGQSTYTGAVYGPNRWKGANNQSVMTLVSGGLQLSTTDNTFRIWQQLCDNATKDRLSGKTGTISVIEDGVLYTTTGTFGTRFDAVGAKYTYSVNTSNNEICRIGGGTNGAAVVTAIKVELGSQQTLAHQENGIWVLNEIPDYGEELIKCQTSTADSIDTYANKSLATEQQLAYVETGTTASRAYAVGEYFCWNGLLYRAKTAISSGGTFTVNTNCEQVTEGGLNTLNNDILDRSRQMNVLVPAGKSVDIIVTGNNYAPSHGFFVVCTGNSGSVIAAWLCIGLGIRTTYHVVTNLQASTATVLSLTSTVNGKYTLTNSSQSFQTYMTVTVLQESVKDSLSLSEPY